MSTPEKEPVPGSDGPIPEEINKQAARDAQETCFYKSRSQRSAYTVGFGIAHARTYRKYERELAAYRHLSSQPSPGPPWVKASDRMPDISEVGKILHIKPISKGFDFYMFIKYVRDWDVKDTATFRWNLWDGYHGWTLKITPEVLDQIEWLEETPSVQPIQGEQKSDDDEPPYCDFGGCEVPEGAEGITNCVHCGGELKQVGRCWYHWSSFVDGNLLPDAIVQDISPEEAQPTADYTHVKLESGAVATVSPDASPELLGALNTMCEKAMQMPIADKERPEPKDIHFPEEGRMPNAFIRDVDDHVYLTPILPQCHEMGKEDIWFAGIRDGAQFMYNRLAGVWSMPAAVLQKWCKRVEGENATQSIQIAGLLASNKEWGEKYAEVCRQQQEAKNLIEGFVRIWRAEGNKGGAPKNIKTAIRFLAQFPQPPQAEK